MGVTRINRKSFLAEMRSLLAFMDAEDRDRVLRFYEKLFDQAGEEGEGALLKKLGSPVRQVLQVEKLYRDKDKAAEQAYATEPVGAAVTAAEESAEEPEEENVEQEPAAEHVDVDSFDPPSEENAVDFGAEEEPKEVVETVEEQPEEEEMPEEADEEHREEQPHAGMISAETFAEDSSETEETEEEDDPAVTETIEFAEETETEATEDAELEEAEAEPKAEKEPVGAGRVVAAVFVTIPMILVVVLGFVLSLSLGFSAMGVGLAFGAAGGYLSGYAFGGVTAFLPDILLLSGGVLLSFCLALFFLWLGIWLAVGGIRITIRIVAAVYRGILKRGGQTHE